MALGSNEPCTGNREINTPKQILILRPGALGDAILTLPVLRALLDCGVKKIVILSTPRSWAFANLDRAHISILDFGSGEWLGLFSRETSLHGKAKETLSGCDAAVVYVSDPERVLQSRLEDLGISRVIQSDPPRLGDSADPNATGADHAAHRLLNPVKEFLNPSNFGDDGLVYQMSLSSEPLLRLGDDEISSARDLLDPAARPTKGWLAIHASSGGRGKCWPVERFVQLALKAHRDLGLTPLVLFGPADDEVRAAFHRLWPDEAPFIELYNERLRVVMAALSMVRAFVGNDSGISHLASKCCPTLALFGPTDPRIWSPLGEKVSILKAVNDHWDGLDIEAVWRALNNLVASGTKAN